MCFIILKPFHIRQQNTAQFHVSASLDIHMYACTYVDMYVDSSIILLYMHLCIGPNPVMVTANVIPTWDKIVITVSWQVCTYEEHY